MRREGRHLEGSSGATALPDRQIDELIQFDHNRSGCGPVGRLEARLPGGPRYTGPSEGRV